MLAEPILELPDNDYSIGDSAATTAEIQAAVLTPLLREALQDDVKPSNPPSSEWDDCEHKLIE